MASGMKIRFTVILFIVLFNCPGSFAQKDSMGMVQAYDTNYYRKYPERLVVGLYQSYRNYDIAINQMSTKQDSGKSKLDYIADANVVTGISVAYDKFSFSLGFRTKPSTPADVAAKGNTT